MANENKSGFRAIENGNVSDDWTHITVSVDGPGLADALYCYQATFAIERGEVISARNPTSSRMGLMLGACGIEALDYDGKRAVVDLSPEALLAIESAAEDDAQWALDAAIEDARAA